MICEERAMRVLRQRYALEREIGRGASGGVWVARDVHLGRHVAVKLLHPDQIESAESRRLFEREARTLAQLRSPHVVQVFDAGIDDDQPFIVMELLDGENLEDRLRRRGCGPRAPSEVAEIVAELARGLFMTHRTGLVHRDLKPANVFLAREQDRETMKLVDFGLADTSAQAVGASARTGFAGTPAYMSPEQFAGDVVDAQADLWALAVLAFELLTGKLPFAGATLLELKERIDASTFPAPSSLVPELTRAVDGFFVRAFARSVTDRFETAVALASEFLKITNGPCLTTRVLVLDDEPDIQLLLEQRFRKAIREERYSFVFAGSGVEGLAELARPGNFDAVLTDINMPAMDGLSFLARVPEIDPYVRVVVVSAYSDMLNIRAAMNRGAFDFICKPLDFVDLERTLERAGAATASLRRSHRIREERDIMRAVLGPTRADHVVNDLGSTKGNSPQAVTATVVAAGVCGFERMQGRELGDLFGHLSLRFELVLEEFARHGAWLVRFQGNVTLAFFRDTDAVGRAVEACLGARDRLMALPTSDEGGPLSSSNLAFGVATGEVLVGALGSASEYGIDQVVLGQACEEALALQCNGGPTEILVVANHEPDLRSSYILGLPAPPTSAVRSVAPEAIRILRHSSVRDGSRDAELEHADGTLPIPPEAWAAGAQSKSTNVRG
jgi:eukaryotic-like serine/threonine-protein kinase